MKHLFMAFVMMCIVAAMTSCKTTEGKTMAMAGIDGEWLITEVDGHSITTPEGEQEAYISFDTKRKSLAGCAGCNRIFGNFDYDAGKRTINLGNIASTKMMCADMTTEDLILGALGKLTTYEGADGNTLVLKSADGKNFIKLVKNASK